MTFPDEKMLAILLHTSDAYGTTDGIQVALTDYRTRTGIDVGDVVAKLSFGTHVIVPVEPTEAMCTASALALDKEKQRLGLNVQNPKAFKPHAKHAIRYRAMIRAAQEKVE